MPRNTYIILVLVLVVYALLNLFRPGGLMAYFFPSVCWGLLAVATLKVCGFERIRLWFNKRVFFMAALIGIFQIVALIDAGLVTGFGKSPHSFTPRGLTINSIYVLSPLLGIELSRAHLMKNFGRRKPVLTLGLVTLLYSFIMSMSIVGFLGLLTSNDPLPLADFLGSRFLPTLTANLLASYLALIGGPMASLAYRGPVIAFESFSPILPDLTWGFEALIGVMVPTIGFVVVSQTTPQKILRKFGIQTEPKKFARPKAKKSSLRGWTIISILCVLLVWASTGLLGFYPTVVASGSMRPTMEVGDLAIVVSTDPSKIQVGDVIQYWQEGEMTLHRVVDIHQTEGSRLFVTKGDDNPISDANPVFPAQIRGKLIFTIPKLGWIPIYTKTAIANVWSFLTANTILAYVMLTTITSMASIYAIHAYKNRPRRYWRRKRGR